MGPLSIASLLLSIIKKVFMEQNNGNFSICWQQVNMEPYHCHKNICAHMSANEIQVHKAILAR